MKSYDVFQTTHFENGSWVNRLAFYTCTLDLDSINLTTDWRFCEVPGKRKRAKYLGTCKTVFPVVYPIKILSGEFKFISK